MTDTNEFPPPNAADEIFEYEVGYAEPTALELAAMRLATLEEASAKIMEVRRGVDSLMRALQVRSTELDNDVIQARNDLHAVVRVVHGRFPE